MSAMDKAELVGRQSNVHDGTVLLYEYDNECRDGAYVTVLGRADTNDDEPPTIVVFDLDDLKCLVGIYAELTGGAA